jgi:hypothetical protein
MPSRGYRKGRSDNKVPRPELLRARAATRTRQRLEAEAASRRITLSALIAEVLEARAARRPTQLPHPRGVADDALHQLARAGNNLNQVARQANLMNLHLIRDRALAAIAAVDEAARRLV